MPIYGYRCPTCASEFEVSRRLSARQDPVFCPADGAEATRLLSAPATLGSPRRAEDAGGGQGAARSSSSWSHFGHSHGAGASPHAH